MEKQKRPHISKKIREKILNMFGGKCAYCGCMPKKLVVDHIEPVAYQGYGDARFEENNFFPACFSCNSFKGALRLEDFRKQLSEQANRARLYSVNYRMALKYGLITENPNAEIIFYFETKLL